MRSHSLGLVAANALSASAFLIPAGIAPLEGVQEMSITVVNPKNQIIRLPCSACAFSPAQRGEESFDSTQDGDDLLWIQGGANDVLLNFTVSRDQTLEMNGLTVYPFDGPETFPQVLQVSSSASVQQIERGEVRVTPLDVTTMAFGFSEDNDITPFGDSITSIFFAVLGLEEQPVALEKVEVELLKTVEGELLILDVSTSHSWAQSSEVTAASVPHKHTQSCGSLPGPLCDVKNFIGSKIDSFRRPSKASKPGCGGRRPINGKLPSHIKPGFLHPEITHEEFPPHGPHGDHERRPHHDGPDHGRPHHEGMHHGGPHHGRRPHHSHRHHHSFFESLARGFVAIVVPTLIGVAVGVSISAFGLIVGHLVGYIWHTFVRRGQQGYQSLALDEANLDSVESQDEKPVIENELHQEQPPVYEHLPAYEKKTDSDQ